MDLTSLNGRWWDWAVASWSSDRLVLIADNDLTYHHLVEVTFSGVEFVTLASTFSHPVFRAPTSEETARVDELLGSTTEIQVFACDAEAGGTGGAFIVAAESVTFVEGLWLHQEPPVTSE